MFDLREQVMTMELIVTQASTNPPVSVLAIKGEVSSGAEGVDRLRQLVESLIGEGVTNLVVDLTDAEFMVSRALGQILTTAVRLRSRGGDMTVSGAKGPVAAAALAVGVGAMVQFHQTVDQAVNALINRPSAASSRPAEQ